MTPGRLAKWGLILIGTWVALVAVTTIITQDLWLSDVLMPVGFLLVLAGGSLLLTAGILKLVDKSSHS